MCNILKLYIRVFPGPSSSRVGYFILFNISPYDLRYENSAVRMQTVHIIVYFKIVKYLIKFDSRWEVESVT